MRSPSRRRKQQSSEAPTDQQEKLVRQDRRRQEHTLPKLAPDKHCNARRTKTQDYCKRPAGWGTIHTGWGRCRNHGGSTRQGNRSAELLKAEAAASQYGIPVKVNPQEALLQELERTAGAVAWLELIVKRIEQDKLVGPVGQSGTSAEGTRHHPSWEPNVWIKLYQAERKHMVDVAKTCIAAGVEERQVRIAERQGALVADAIRAIFGKLEDLLGVSILQRPEAMSIVGDELRRLSGQSAGEQPAIPAAPAAP